MKVLFVGLGGSPPSWYRCGLPAYSLSMDWIGTDHYPIEEGGILFAGNISEYHGADKYDIIVVQQALGVKWEKTIKMWQKQGKKVLYEIDDFIHGVRKIEHHSNKKQFNKKRIKEYEACMRLADGMICSTEFLSEQYKKFNPNRYVCEVGIDTTRYKVEFPQREEIIFGWAGGTGHLQAVQSWAEEIFQIIRIYDKVKFVSIGTDYADTFNELCPGKAYCVPWVSIENYPYALANLDFAIAPCHISKYYKAKSNLRWLEASAVGIPTVASPIVYGEIEHGTTGFLAETPEDAGKMIMNLIDDIELRQKIGKQAQDYVVEHKDIGVLRYQWTKVFNHILNQ